MAIDDGNRQDVSPEILREFEAWMTNPVYPPRTPLEKIHTLAEQAVKDGAHLSDRHVSYMIENQTIPGLRCVGLQIERDGPLSINNEKNLQNQVVHLYRDPDNVGLRALFAVHTDAVVREASMGATPTTSKTDSILAYIKEHNGLNREIREACHRDIAQSVEDGAILSEGNIRDLLEASSQSGNRAIGLQIERDGPLSPANTAKLQERANEIKSVNDRLSGIHEALLDVNEQALARASSERDATNRGTSGVRNADGSIPLGTGKIVVTPVVPPPAPGSMGLGR